MSLSLRSAVVSFGCAAGRGATIVGWLEPAGSHVCARPGERTW